MFESSKTNLQTKNIDSSSTNKLNKNSNNKEISSKLAINREQQTTIPLIDPVLIATIHSNKGAIDTIRGQITELRHDVDQLRLEINNKRTNTCTQDNEIRRTSKSETNNHNQSSVSHHHHHHHHVEQGVTRKRSSVCILL